MPVLLPLSLLETPENAGSLSMIRKNWLKSSGCNSKWREMALISALAFLYLLLLELTLSLSRQVIVPCENSWLVMSSGLRQFSMMAVHLLNATSCGERAMECAVSLVKPPPQNLCIPNTKKCPKYLNTLVPRLESRIARIKHMHE